MNPLRKIPIILSVALIAFLVLSPLAASTAGATVAVKTNQPNYSNAQSLTVFGTVSPTPTTTTYITIIAKNPQNVEVLIGVTSVSSSNGSFSEGFVTGGTNNWIPGIYTVNATYVSGAVSGSDTTTFSYSTTSVSTSKTTTTSLTMSTSTSSSKLPVTTTTRSSSTSTTTSTVIKTTLATASTNSSTSTTPSTTTTSSTLQTSKVTSSSTSTTQASGGLSTETVALVVVVVVVIVAAVGFYILSRRR